VVDEDLRQDLVVIFERIEGMTRRMRPFRGCRDANHLAAFTLGANYLPPTTRANVAKTPCCSTTRQYRSEASCRRRAKRTTPVHVRFDPTGCVRIDNESVRLIHRERPRQESLEEGECYDHSYGEHVSDHVELIRLEPAGVRVEIPVEVETEHHVTTQRLKGQFEERRAARTRRSRRARR
jgi:hypothetical protein